MISVERVIEYTDLEKEAPWELEYHPPPSWPNKGMISFNYVNFSHKSDGRLVLKNLYPDFHPRQKPTLNNVTRSKALRHDTSQSAKESDTSVGLGNLIYEEQ